MSDNTENEAAQKREQETQSLIQDFRKQEMGVLVDSVDLFYKGLVVDPLENPNKLPESIFVNVFLPYFRGDEDFKENPTLLGNWYAIAGSHVSEVLIVDAEGKALYKVPPYINNRAIDPTHNQERKEMSLHDIDGSAEAMSRNIPIVGRNFREQKWAEKILDMTANGAKPDDYLYRWAEIFARYESKESTQSNNDKESDAKQVKGQLTDDDLEF